ncbi:tRNA (guanosine(46)-N7)-methyltransferase TrmB [Chlamydiales bacterium]|nr:tRNA (guanosine(46)-N7)-methyltransferase TrmB [Chlamydiales bacterium]
MKPQNLSSIFTRDKPRVVIEDRVWYVPERVENNFTFNGFDQPEFFNNNNPIILEYCSGNGHWIVDRAQKRPDYNFLAIEKKWERIRKIWSKTKNHQLSNLIAVCGEGQYITETFLQSATIDAVYINFPDPWPKRRHAKHRIINPLFIDEIHRILITGKQVTVTTDDKDYSDEIVELFLRSGKFTPKNKNPYYQTEYPGYGSSNFEELWREKGKEIRYHIFIKEDLK